MLVLTSACFSDTPGLFTWINEAFVLPTDSCCWFGPVRYTFPFEGPFTTSMTSVWFGPHAPSCKVLGSKSVKENECFLFWNHHCGDSFFLDSRPPQYPPLLTSKYIPLRPFLLVFKTRLRSEFVGFFFLFLPVVSRLVWRPWSRTLFPARALYLSPS